MNYCPLFFNLKNKDCVVVGGGKVAYRRVKKLLDYGAAVRLISPEVLPEIEEMLLADRIQKTAYKREFICEAFLIIAVTNNPGVNRQIRLLGS
ncbi:MAG: hypothetical protein FH762_16830 [Firmicutes bacterium]|nr:hypothetical protein [Bacillota bacterium]